MINPFSAEASCVWLSSSLQGVLSRLPGVNTADPALEVWPGLLYCTQGPAMLAVHLAAKLECCKVHREQACSPRSSFCWGKDTLPCNCCAPVGEEANGQLLLHQARCAAYGMQQLTAGSACAGTG